MDEKTPQEVAEKLLQDTNEKIEKAKADLKGVQSTTNTEKIIHEKLKVKTEEIKADQVKEQTKLDTITQRIVAANTELDSSTEEAKKASQKLGDKQVELKKIDEEIEEHKHSRTQASEEASAAHAANDLDRKRIKKEIGDISEKLAVLKQEYDVESARIAKEKTDATRQLALLVEQIDEKKEEVRGLSEILTELTSREDVLKYQIGALETTKSTGLQDEKKLEGEIRTLRTQVVNLEEKIEQEEDKLKALRAEAEAINTTKFQLARLKEELEGREEMLKEKFKQAGVKF